MRPIGTYLASRRYVATWVVRFTACVVVASAPLVIPIPGALDPVDIVATFPLAYGLGAAATLTSTLYWMGEPPKIRVTRLLVLVLGSGAILGASLPALAQKTDAWAIIGSALLVEAGAMLGGRVRGEAGWIVAAVLGLALPLQTAWTPLPLYLSVPSLPAAALWLVAAVVHVGVGGRRRLHSRTVADRSSTIR
jgi:hypothetical protein